MNLGHPIPHQRNSLCLRESTDVSSPSFDIEAALRIVVEGTSAATGEHFFRSLAYYLACALRVRYALITRCIEGEGITRVQTLAFWQGSDFGQNFSYTTADTPCQQVLNGQTCYYPAFVRQKFPQDLDLLRLSAEAYLGVPITSSAGEVLGHLVVMHDQPREPEPLGLCIMEIFAVRAGAELERQAVMEKLSYESLHDPLTRLPNRTYVNQRLSAACQHLKHHPEHPFVVLFMDLDRFKVINDSLGHAAGDQLLVEVGKRLSACLGAKDTVARIGGDEFAILLEDPDSCAQTLDIVARLQQVLAAAFKIHHHDVHIAASIGIVFSAPALTRPIDYLRNADLAMYQAKRQGSGHLVFNQQMHTQAVYRLNQEAALQNAINQGELQLHYQPIFSLSTQALIGFEALLRWWCPAQQSNIAPAEFIPLAEETGLMIPLGWWVIQEACYQLRTWQTHFNRPELTMSINLSNKQFEQRDVVEQMMQIIRTTGVEPRQLRFELTESMLMSSPACIEDAMQKLCQFDIQFHLDNFGQGYCSLSALHDLPINAVKIDPAFISRMAADKPSLGMVRTIMALANNLGISCIAEGIETPHQLQHLQALRCPLGQGYLIAPPLPSGSVSELMIEGSPERIPF